MNKVVNIHEAKTHFSRILDRVMGGEVIIIAKAGKPVARLMRITRKPAVRRPGSAAGQITIARDFEEPLPEFDQ